MAALQKYILVSVKTAKKIKKIIARVILYVWHTNTSHFTHIYKYWYTQYTPYIISTSCSWLLYTSRQNVHIGLNERLRREKTRFGRTKIINRLISDVVYSIPYILNICCSQAYLPIYTTIHLGTYIIILYVYTLLPARELIIFIPPAQYTYYYIMSIPMWNRNGKQRSHLHDNIVIVFTFILYYI